MNMDTVQCGSYTQRAAWLAKINLFPTVKIKLALWKIIVNLVLLTACDHSFISLTFPFDFRHSDREQLECEKVYLNIFPLPGLHPSKSPAKDTPTKHM